MIKTIYTKYIIFLFASLAISIGLQILLPWPYGFISAISLFIIFPLIINLKNRNNINGLGKFDGMTNTKIHMYCARCSKQSNDRQCPRCGSRVFNVR